jgi:hypothetical protein
MKPRGDPAPPLVGGEIFNLVVGQQLKRRGF